MKIFARPMSVLMLLVMTGTTTLHASEAECVARCEKALEAQDSQIAKLHEKSSLQAVQLKDYNRMLDERDAKLQSPWRNPWVVGTLGVVVGAVLTGVLVGVAK